MSEYAGNPAGIVYDVLRNLRNENCKVYNKIRNLRGDTETSQ